MEKWVGDMIFSYFSAHKLWQVLTKRHRGKIALSAATVPSETQSLHWGGWYYGTFSAFTLGSRNPASPGALAPPATERTIWKRSGRPLRPPQ